MSRIIPCRKEMLRASPCSIPCPRHRTPLPLGPQQRPSGLLLEAKIHLAFWLAEPLVDTGCGVEAARERHQARRSEGRAGGSSQVRPLAWAKATYYFSWLQASSYLLSPPSSLVFLQPLSHSFDLSCLVPLPSLPHLPSAHLHSL